MEPSNMVPVRPILDQVLLREQKNQNSSLGGILLAGKEKEQKRYLVVAVGPIGSIRDKDVKMPLQPGDVVIINESRGKPIAYNNQMYVIIQAEDVYATVN